MLHRSTKNDRFDGLRFLARPKECRAIDDGGSSDTCYCRQRKKKCVTNEIGNTERE